MNLSLYIYTLGCRLNQVESEAMAEKFEKAGFVISQENADLYIINSCTVTSKAEQKMRRVLRDFSSSKPCIITGCAVKGDKKKELEEISDNVIAVDIDDKYRILQFPEFILQTYMQGDSLLKLAQGFFNSHTPEVSYDNSQHKFDFSVSNFHFHHKGFLKIQDGCNMHCSFCAVSISRGEPVSLDIDQVIKRFCMLQDSGYKEICLTGVNLALYHSNGYRLSDLICKLKDIVKDDVKIRLSSLEPDLIDRKLIEAISLPFVCDYIHLSIQSLSQKVLFSTGRKYNGDDIEKIVSDIRKIKKDPFISADIMTGLPCEDNNEFDITYEGLKKLKLAYIHVFPFSKRKGTRAYDMQVPEQRVRDLRAEKLRKLAKQQHFEYVRKFVGKVVSGIIETSESDCMTATSDNYLKINIRETSDVEIKKRYNILITELTGGAESNTILFGKVLN